MTAELWVSGWCYGFMMNYCTFLQSELSLCAQQPRPAGLALCYTTDIQKYVKKTVTIIAILHFDRCLETQDVSKYI